MKGTPVLAPLGVAVLAAVAFAAAPSVDSPEFLQAWNGIHGDAIAKHVQVLASDEFEGRSPGTKGEVLTLAYITKQFRDAGLVPAGDHGYAQEVPLAVVTPRGTPSITFHAGAATVTPAFGGEFVTRLGRPLEHVAIQGSGLVFAGHGTVAPEYGWDDYAGVDLKGKTVVLLYGDPGTASRDSTIFLGRTGTRHSTSNSKYLEAARRGARAIIVVHTDSSAGYPWKTLGGGGLGSSQYFLAPEKTTPTLEALVYVSEPTARSIFKAAGVDFDAEARAAHTRGFHAHPLRASIDVALEGSVRPIKSHNLIGIIPGSGAPDEAVLLMAHWDHMGRDSTLKGDQIFNGAVDNATGVGALLEVVKAFRQMPSAPRRTVVFVATTAEERGLLGAEYLARHPVRPLAKTAAAVALDAFFPYGAYDHEAVTGFGFSELEEILAVSAAHTGRKLEDDGAPEQGTFYRADNYPFCKRGVPGFLAVGNPDNAGLPKDSTVNAALVNYVTTKYHQPSDEYDAATWNMAGIEGDARTYFEFAWRLAEDRRFPRWRWDSPYRVLGDSLQASRPK